MDEGALAHDLSRLSCAALQLTVNGVDIGGPQTIPALGYAQWTAPYAPGNYTITSLDSTGKVLGTFASFTAGPPAALSAEIEWPGSGPGGACAAMRLVCSPGQL